MGRHIVELLQRRAISHSAFTHAELDITDRAASARVMSRERPEWVINCAALCSFDACEIDPERSRSVNFEAPLRWAELCHARGVKLAHFSSDYIFDGAKGVPYLEEDTPVPRSVYARHKADIENAFQAFPEHLILRVAWLFGKGAPTFMSQMPRLILMQEKLTVASGKRGSCLFAGYGAQLTLALIDAGAAGIVNAVHSGETAWEVFAEECLRQLRGRGLEPRCRFIEEVPFDHMPIMRAGRPPYSVLNNDKLAGITGYRPISWQEGIGQYLNALFSGE